MDENRKDEKLLPGPEAEGFPLLNAKEFLKRTPPRELRDVFGAGNDDETHKPAGPADTPASPNENPVQKPGNAAETLPRLAEKDAIETKTSEAESKVKPKVKIGWRQVMRFLLGLLLFIVVIITTLYVWGGVIK